MRQNYKYLLLPLIFSLSNSLSFFSTFNDVTLPIFLPVEFDCWVTHVSPVTISWSHNSNDFTCNSLCVPIRAGYSFGSGVAQSATLYRMTIGSVELTDTGTVTCKATLSNGSFISSTATLTVNDVIAFLRIPVSQTRSTGDMATFDCSVNKGGGTFVWKRGNSIVDPTNARYTITSFGDNSSITITELTTLDQLGYTCEYSLSGDVIKSGANLFLSDYTAPYVLTGSVQQANLVLGQTAVTCPVEGDHIPADITWYHNGNQVPVSSNQGPYSPAGILQFDLSTESDSGMYTCVVSDGVTIANGTVTVTVTTITGVLSRWYVIMGICVAVISVVCVGGAFVLSLLCCCYDRRNERKLEEKYRNRLSQMKSRRTQRSVAAKQQFQRATAVHVGDIRGDGNKQMRRHTELTNMAYSERNADGSVTYSVEREAVRVNMGHSKRPNTVSEITNRPPTHLARQAK